MSNADTVKAVITNIETILAASPRLLRKLDTPTTPEELPNFDEPPVFYVLYDGESPEYEHGQKPGYVEASLIVALLWQSTSISDARGKSIDWYHAVRSALTVTTLNAGDLATTKLVSKVVVEKPQVEMQPAETRIMYATTVRYRET